MFGLGKKQTASSGNSMDLGLRTMKSDLKSPYEEIHERLDMPVAQKNKELAEKKSSPANPVPQNLPVAETKISEKTSAIPESSIQGANLKFNESFKNNEFHSKETDKIEKKEFNKPKMNYPKPPSLPVETKKETAPKQKVPQIPDKIKQEINSEYAKPQKKTSSGINKGLLILTAVVFILTLGSGVYYYFFILNAQNEPEITETTPVEVPSPTEVTEETPEVEEVASIPAALSESVLLTIDDKGIAAATSGLPTSESGIFYKLANQDGPITSPVQQNKALGINLSEIEPDFQDGWIFLANNDQGELRTALVYELSALSQAQEKVSSIESSLPSKLLGTFIGTTPPSVTEAVIFKDSEFNQKVRYYNYTPGDPTKSVDWTIAEINGSQFLIFANSRATMTKVIDALGI